jgi:hypothetical protein
VDKDQLPVQIDARAQLYETQELSGTIRKHIQRNNDTLQQGLVAKLDEHVAHLMDDTLSGNSLELVKAFSGGLREQLSIILTDLREQRNQRQEELNLVDIDTRSKQLQQTLQSWFDMGGSKRKNAMNALIAEYRKKFQFRFDIMSLDTAIQILSLLINRLDDYIQDTETLRNHLQYAAERFQQANEVKTRGWSRMEDAFNQIITDSDDLEDLYTRYVTDVTQQLSRLTSETEAGPLHAWRARYPTAEEISQMLLRFAIKVFSPIYSIRLEDEILRKREEEQPAQRLQLLRQTSTPFWSVKYALVPDGGANVESLMIVAVENEETSIYKAELQERGTKGSTTLDHHRITVLQTKHGIPVSALAQIEDYQRIYNRYINQGSIPLHLFPEPDAEEAKLAFALGEAFAFIQEQGVSDYVLIDREDGTTIKLGEDFLSAFRQFSTKLEYVTRTRQATEKHITAVGKQQAAEALQHYSDVPVSADPSRSHIQEQLRQLARNYRKQRLI